MMKYSFTFAALLLSGLASSHTIFTQLTVDGVTYGVGEGIRVPSYDGPIEDVSTVHIACNGGPNPTTPSDVVLNVKAGSTVRARWRHTLTSGPEDVIDASHKGPVQAYLKKVTDAKTDSGIGDGWFKISAAGLDVDRNTWAITDLIEDLGEQEIPIPSCIEDGQYLLRAELIALHSASSVGAAQFYMECAQINISGGSATKVPSTVSLPGEYSSSDPGIHINIYQDLQSYDIPGPDIFTC